MHRQSFFRSINKSMKVKLIFIGWIFIYCFLVIFIWLYVNIYPSFPPLGMNMARQQYLLYLKKHRDSSRMYANVQRRIYKSSLYATQKQLQKEPRLDHTDLPFSSHESDEKRRNVVIPEEITVKAKTKTQPYYSDDFMLKLHEKSSQKFTSQQILDYYRREIESERRFSWVMDLHKDRDLLKTLFPIHLGDSNDRITDQLRVRLNVSGQKLIYLTKEFGANSRKKFQEDNCNVKQCIFTTNPKDLHKADAILDERRFSSYHLKPGQLRIVYFLESALNYPDLDYTNYPLNWTATYRRDSVLSAPYGRFVPFTNISELPSIPKRNFAKRKNKMIAWFVSNCNADNGRSDYVDELKQFIAVDIFGRCGKSRCNKHDSSCFRKVKEEYKFYLSLENSNCKDYVTEKMFENAFKNDVIPIVMGAHRNEYKRIAPPNSYIHVDDFESPKQLAEYLKFLDGNDDAYNQYFLWKDTGRFINTKFMCRLCTMVHLAPLFPMWYSDVNDWWTKDMCRKRNEHWKEVEEAKANKWNVNYGF